ncbi:MAG: class I SAM-dependent methyltransferase [Chloroflexota bacterium]
MNPRLQVEASFYLRNKLETRGRFTSYWHQLDELIRLNPENILEIGVGDRFMSKYLRDRGGMQVTTLDIDAALQPDVAGSVLAIPFAEGSFRAVACFEVLEHLPYDQFGTALAEIRRVSNRHVVLSLPDARRVFRIQGRLPWIGRFQKMTSFLPGLKPPGLPPDGYHFWEIGVRGYALDQIQSHIEHVGFRILRTYQNYDYVRHRFFVLEKR